MIFDVGFRLTGKELDKIVKPSIDTLSQEIDQAFQNAGAKGSLTRPINEAISAANALQSALKAATTDKGLSFTAMQQSLRRSNTTVEQMVARLGSAGPQFANSFNLALTSIASANRQVITLSSKLQEAARVFTQSFKFTAAQSAIRFLSSTISQTTSWVKELDSTLAEIAVVTGKTGDSLQTVYKNIITGAADLRVAASEYAKASVIFYQQGLNDSEVEKRTTITIQAAQAAGQSVETMASQLTAIWNSYNMIGEEQSRAAAVGAALAANTAVDFADIAEAMQIAAAAANQMGVSYDSLAAIIATVGDATQQSASIIGNAYKTIFSRFQQLTTEGTDGEVTLNSVSSKLQSLGVHVLDSSNKLKELDDVIMDVGLSWDNYTEEQQLAIAELVGGTRQYGQFLSLMQNFPEYLKNMKTATEETGETLIEQFLAARQTVEAAAEMSQEAWSKAMAQLFDADSMKEFYNKLESTGKVVGDVIKAFGGLPGILVNLGFLFQRNISDKIIDWKIQLTDIVKNLTPELSKANLATENQKQKDSLALAQGIANTNSADASGAMIKLDAANKLKAAFIDVNRLINSSSEEAQNLGNNLMAALTNTQNRFNSLIDDVTSMQHGFQDIVGSLRQQEILLEETSNTLSLLDEEDRARATILQENIVNLEREAVGRAFELETLQQEATLTNIQCNKEIERLNIEQQRLQLLMAIAQLDATDPGKSDEEQQQITQKIAGYQRIISALEGQKKAQQQLKNETNAGMKTMKQSYQQFTERIAAAKKELQELRNKGNDMKNVAKVANQVSQGFYKFGDALADSIKDSENFGTRVKGNFQNLISSMPTEEMQTKMREMFSDEAIDQMITEANGDTSLFLAQLVAKIQSFNNDPNNKVKINIDEEMFLRLGRAGDGIRQTMEDIENSEQRVQAQTATLGQTVQGGIQEFVKATMSVLTLANATTRLGEAIGKGELSFTTFLSTLVQIIPAIVSIVTVLNKSAKATQLQAAMNTLLEATHLKAAATALVQAAAQALLKKNLEGTALAAALANVALAAMVAIVAIAVIGITALFAAEEKEKEKRKETAETALEEAQAIGEATNSIREQVDAFNESYDAMQKATKGSEAYIEAQANMQEAIDGVIDKLKEERDLLDDTVASDLLHDLSVAKQSGDENQMKEAVDKTNEELTRAAIEEYEQARAAAGATFIDDMRDGVGHFTGNKYKAEIGNGTFYSQWDGDEKIASDALAAGTYSHISKDAGGDLMISSDQTAEDMIAAYTEALKLKKEMDRLSNGKSEILNNSEIYGNLVDWLDKASEAYDRYKEAVAGSVEQQQALFNIDPAALISILDEIGKDVSGIDVDKLTTPEDGFASIADYEAWRENVEKVGEAAGWSATQIEDLVYANDAAVEAIAAQDFINESVQGLRDAGNDDRADEIVALLEDEYANLKAAGLEDYFNDLEIDLTLNDAQLKQDLDNQVKKFQDLELKAQIELDIDDTEWQEQMKLANGLSIGDTISAEDFEKLGEAYSSFFQLMEDGSYQLIGSAEELEDAIEGMQQQRLTQDAISASEAAQKYAPGGENEDPAMYEQLLQTSAAAQQQVLATADSVYELAGLYQSLGQEMYNTLGDDTVLSYQAYANALMGLATNYDNTTKEIEEYQEALASGNNDQIRAAQGALEASTLIGECAEKYDLEAEALEYQAKALRESIGQEKISAKAAAQLAVNNQRMNKGIDTLNDSWEDWKDTLATTSKTSEDYAKAAVGITNSLKDIVGAADDFELPDGFLDSPENLKLIEEAANGSQDAINQLGLMFAIAEVQALEMDEALVTAAQDTAGGLKEALLPENFDFDTTKTKVLEGLETIQSKLGELEAGASLADILGGEEMANEWVDNLNQLAIATGMTVEDMNALLSEVGMTAEVTETDIEQTDSMPTTVEKFRQNGNYTVTNHIVNTDGTEEDRTASYPIIEKWTEEGSPVEVTKHVKVAQISSDGTAPAAANVNYVGTGGGKAAGSSPKSNGTKPSKSSGGSGGSNSTPNKTSSVSKTKKENVTERYLNIKSAIDDNTRALERFNNQADDAWGNQRIKNMAVATQLLQRQAKYYSRLAKEAANYMPQDLNAIAVNENITTTAYNARTEYGITADFAGIAANFRNMLKFNNDKTVANMEDVLNYGQSLLDNYWQEYQTALESYNATYAGKDESDASKAAKEALDERKGIYDLWKEFIDGEIEAVNKYDETANEAYEALQNAVNAIRDWMTSKVDRLKAQIELIMKPDQTQMKRLERVADQMGDAARKLGKSSDLALKQINNLMSQNETNMMAAKRAGQILENIAASGSAQDLDPDAQDWFRKQFGEEAWEEYLNGNGGVPEQVMEYLVELRDTVEDNLYQITDLAMEELDNVYAGIEDWFNSFSNMIDNELAKTEATLDFYQTVSDWIDPDKITGSQQAVQRSLNYNKMESTKTAAIGEIKKGEAAKKLAQDAEERLREAEAEYDAAMAAGDEIQAQWFAGQISRYQEEAEKYNEEFESYSVSAIEGVTELFSTAQEVLESQKSMAKNALAASLESLFVTVDQISDVYDSIKNYQSMYLDPYDKKYELDTLQRTFDLDIEESDIDLSQYEGLVKWQEKLNQYKEEGKDMTEEELSVLQAEYEYQKAMAELEMQEEARKNNKNTMRLSRDASGNYSYVYSGDTGSADSTANLEQKAADAEKKYRDAINDAQEAFQDSSMETYQALIEHLDSFSEELYARSPEYRQWYDSQLSMLLEEYDAATKSTNQMFEIMGESANTLRIQYADTAMGVMTQTQSMDEAHKTWRDALVGSGYEIGGEPGGYYGAIIQAETQMATTLQEAADAIGEADGEGILGDLNLQFGLTKDHTVGDLVAIQGGITATTTKTAEETTNIGNILKGDYHNNWDSATTDTLNHLGGPDSKADDGSVAGGLFGLQNRMKNMVDETGNSLQNQLNSLETWKTTFTNKFAAAKAAVQELIDKIDELERKEAARAKEALQTENNTNGGDDGYTTPEDLPQESPAVTETTPSSPGTPVQETPNVNDTMPSIQRAEEVYSLINRGKLGTGVANRIKNAAALGYTTEEALLGQALINGRYPTSLKGQGYGWTDAAIQWAKDIGYFSLRQKFAGYATGGLVSEEKIIRAGEEGPELVLNAEDTKNILAAVAMMRQTVAGQLGSLNGALGAQLQSYSSAVANYTPTSQQQTVDQQVKIEASFPGVSVAQEIEDALNSLITQAAQYNIKR